MLVFGKLEQHLRRKVVTEMYERSVSAGEILIKEGDTGMAASELYVVKTGKFEVSSLNAGTVLCCAGPGSKQLVKAAAPDDGQRDTIGVPLSTAPVAACICSKLCMLRFGQLLCVAPTCVGACCLAMTCAVCFD